MKVSNEKEILAKTEAFVREKLKGEGSGHDWWHIHRVRNTALAIAREEKADLFIVELAALLHDIADHKFHDGDDTIGPKVAREWLDSLSADEDTIDHISTIIKEVSFKGAGVATPMSTVEGDAVQDADRLDAIGAIGIARAFAYGGHKNRLLYDPDDDPKMHHSFEEYKSDKGATINHFYEKLLLLKERMNTEAGRNLAEQRHHFMEDFLKQFMDEWNPE